MRTLCAVFAGLLAVLLLARVRRVVALSVAGVLICGVVIPQPVYAQLEFVGLFGAIDAVLNTVNGVLKSLLDLANSVLNQIKSIFQAFWNLMDTVVYPKALIARAQGMVSAMIGQFRALLTNIFNIGVSSGQLPHPAALEIDDQEPKCGRHRQGGRGIYPNLRPSPGGRLGTSHRPRPDGDGRRDGHGPTEGSQGRRRDLRPDH
ncbi:MAG: hypothetical protein ACUVXB_16390 [Bryobacteraceae bacterium]